MNQRYLKLIIGLLLFLSITFCSHNVSNKIKKEATRDLFIAANIENESMTQKAIIRGADVNSINKKGWTPLLASAYNESYRADVAKILLDHGADIEAKDKLGRTALFIAINNNKIKLASLLIEKGTEINTKDNKGKSPFFIAIKKNKRDIIGLLLEKGINIQTRDYDGKTPLIASIFTANIKTIKLLLDKGAEVNSQGEDGWTALHVAVSGNMIKITKLLISHGADVNIKDKRGQTPLFYSHGPLKQILLDHGAESLDISHK